jgi:hypothetical protein
MNSRVYPKDVFDSAIRKMAEERKQRLFIEENTRKVLVEKTKKPKIYGADLVNAIQMYMNADVIIGIKRTQLDGQD